jgi:hypothetical protein
MSLVNEALESSAVPLSSPDCPSAPSLQGVSAWRLLAVVLALAGWLPACLCPPSADALLDVGYRSPEQTVRTFQTGVRGDLPDLEYGCLSSGFRRRNNLSKLIWREFREDLFRENPFLRTGLVKAKIVAVETEGARSRIVIESFGRSFELELAREDFAQLYAGEELVLDREIPFDQWTTVESTGEEAWFTGGAPLPAGSGERDITELRLGREWKIDDFRGELPEQ